MKHRNTKRYAVKTSKAAYSSIVSSHYTLPEAYRAYVKLHKNQQKGRRFIMAQEPIAIISTELHALLVQEDIKDWADYDIGPRSKQRLPLPILVHQWSPIFKTYTCFEEKTNDRSRP